MLKCSLMRFLFKKIPPKYFLLSQFALLFFGLLFLFYINYIINIQYKVSDKPFSQGPLTSAPKSFILTLDQPADNSLVFEDSLLISGKSGPNMEILIYSDTQDLVIKSKVDGTFSQSLSLSEGVNNIKVVAFDKEGNSREEKRTLYYSEERL